MSVRLRAVAHRGSVVAAGYLLDTTLLGVDEARRRALAMWRPGTRVYELDTGLVVLSGVSERVRCDRAPGAPLVESDGLLFAAPIDPKVVSRLAPGRGALVFARGGEARAEPLEESRRARPETWLDLSDHVTVEVRSLGNPPPPPSVVAALEEFQARERLAGVPTADPKLEEVIASLRQGGGSRDGARTSSRADVAAGTGQLARLVDRLAHVLTRLLGRGTPSTVPSRATPRRPAFERLSVWMRRFTAHALRLSRLHGVFTRRQAEYIGRMMDMFERGDVLEALRHAIPIAALGEAARDASSPAFGVPRARSSLSITLWRGSASASMALGDELIAEIRALYRAAYERLSAQGRVEEAAFVLAELLQANEEAVAFLERHGKLRLAAELAEARGLLPGLVVRQWFVAGDAERAIVVARRTGAFADAVKRLERTDKERANVLRLLWAGLLADAGDYATAVEVAWPVEEARRLAVRWAEQAIEGGGPAGARMLVRLLEIAPSRFAEVRDHVVTLLEEEDTAGLAARSAFAKALEQAPSTPETRVLARAAARATLRDVGLRPDVHRQRQARRLVKYAGDAALRADEPPMPQGGVHWHIGSRDPVELAFDTRDAGTMPIVDAALLPSGRLLVALGESGAILLSRKGATIAHFDQPAHRLVLSDHGDRAILLAPRGEVWRLARADLLARRSENWCEAPIDVASRDYDGSLWFLGARGDIYAIDATASRFEALWRVPEVGEAIGIARVGSALRFVTLMDEGRHEDWHYTLPTMRLRERRQLASPPQDWIAMMHSVALSADAALAEELVLADPSTGTMSPARVRVYWHERLALEEDLASAQPGPVATAGGWVAAASHGERDTHVELFDIRQRTRAATFRLGGARRAAVRLDEGALVVADDRGRVLVLDLETGRLSNDVRV